MAMSCFCRGGPDCCMVQRYAPPVIIEKHFYPKFELPDLRKPSPHNTPIKPPKQWMPPDGDAMRAEDV